MPKINVLDTAVAELIAAGEVVERPASIVKELVENAIDAGARSVAVEIQGGGIRLIRVADDGCGIEAGDIPKAFLRHATSKVATAEDLGGILTLGFRGEALASIAAMAKVELTTKTDEDSEGTLYRIEGGEFVESGPAGRPTGTTVTVRDVFYNTPARMKFLKKDVGEGNAVAQVVEKCALSHPEIAFRFLRDGMPRLTTSGNGSLQAVFRAIYGGELSAELLEVDYILDGAIRVTGCVGAPQSAKASRTFQSFFINGRYVRSRTCSAALEEAFKNKLMTGRYPICALNLSILAETVDVNVHPAKIEVRFADERPVFNAVFFAVKSALATKEAPVMAQEPPRKSGVNALTLHLPKEEEKQQRMTATEFKAMFAEKEPVDSKEFSRPVRLRSASLDICVDDDDQRQALPVRSKPTELSPVSDKIPPVSSGTIGEEAAVSIPDKEPAFILEDAKRPAIAGAAPEPLSGQAAPYRLIGELFGTYILLEQEGELVLVDKHAAHERMLYERLIENIKYGNRQLLLAPIPVTLSREEYGAVLESPGAMEQLGFGVEDFGDGTLLVREVPVELGERDIPDIVGEIALRLLRGNRSLTPETLDRLYYSIACKSAVRAGDRTSPAELRELVRKLEQNPQITHCPHGRPVSARMTRYQIEKMFGRIV